MKKILTIIAIALFIVSCNNIKSPVEEAKVLSMQEVIASAAELENQQVTIEGMVTHVCQHGGQKMFLTDSTQDLSVLIRVSQSIPEFDVALEGSKVQVTGKMIVSITESEADSHNGEHEADSAECVTEEALKAKGDDTCTTNVTFHIEAASFKEL